MIEMNYYYLSYFIGGIIFCKLFLSKKQITPPMIEYIKNFEPYNIAIMYYMEKAYDIIYKDHIMIYSLEATKIDDNQFNTAVQEFTKLVLKMMGPNFVREYSIFYGSEDTLFFNIVEHFNTRYESDEIRKQSVSDITRHNEAPTESEEGDGVYS